MAESDECEENMHWPCLEIPENLTWIYGRKGQIYFRDVLTIVGLPENETVESNAARTMLSKIMSTRTGTQNMDEIDTQNMDVVVDFLKEMSTSFNDCYKNVEQIKCANKKMVILEKSFTSLHEKVSIKNKWSLLLNYCGVKSSDATNILLNHILQNFWSNLSFCVSRELDSAIGCSSSSYDDAFESIEAESVQHHAGWVLKRVRDLFINGTQMHTIKLSKTSNVQVKVDKHFVLSLIQKLGHDDLVQPGKFLFNPIPEVLEVFTYLHKVIERIVKDGLNASADKDMLKKCLIALSEDAQLRKMWHKLLGEGESDAFKAGSIILLQRVVGMFLKSKQQIIREQLQLKPNKKSSSLRQTVCKGQKPKPRVCEPIECIADYRGNPTDASIVVKFLIDAFGKPEPYAILNKLHGNELTSILQSLGLPGLNGKGKNKQIELLKKHHASGKEWNIVFPEKVSNG